MLFRSCKAAEHIPIRNTASEADAREPEPEPTSNPVSQAHAKETTPTNPKSPTGNGMPEFEAVDISDLF